VRLPPAQHEYVPRKHGARDVCECGARKDDLVHPQPGHLPKEPGKWHRRDRRGQALVEFAIVTPLLLAIMLGGFAIGLMLLDRMQLTHAAQEGAVAGAANSGDSCGVAISTARKIFGRSFSAEACATQGQLLELSLSHQLPIVVPGWADSVTISVTERAALR
jgi:hypothetical protein